MRFHPSPYPLPQGEGENVAPAASPLLAAYGPATPGPAHAMIRPDRLVLGAVTNANQLHGTIRQRLYLGGHFEYLVAVGSASLRVLSSAMAAEGDSVTLSFTAADCIILATDTQETPSWA